MHRTVRPPGTPCISTTCVWRDRRGQQPPDVRDRASAVVPFELRTLTTRELEVFRGASRGLTNAEIAAELYISTATVKTHIANTLHKLSLRDRVQAVVLAYESGLLTPGSHKTHSTALRSVA